MSLDLAIKIVALATGVFGLLKVLGAKAPQMDSGIINPLKPLLILATILGFMLFPLVFVWAFSKMSKAIGTQSTSTESRTANLDSIATRIPPNARYLVQMLQAARLMSTHRKRTMRSDP